MNTRPKLLIVYSFRLLFREWKKYFLPLLSLVFTSVVICLVLFLTQAVSSFLLSKNKEIVGGDIVFRSSYSIEKDSFVSAVPELSFSERYSESKTFNAVISTSNGKSIPVSVETVDSAYPLYGRLLLLGDVPFSYTTEAVYLDKNASLKLGVTVGDTIVFGKQKYIVSGIIYREPGSLLSGFRFLPKMIMTKEGFNVSGLDPSFLRIEYENRFTLSTVKDLDPQKVAENIKHLGAQAELSSANASGIIVGFRLLSEFLILSVLLVCVLSVVNIYASTSHLVYRLKKSFAILLSIGLSRKALFFIINLSFFFVVLFASIVGTGVGYMLFKYISVVMQNSFDISLIPTHIFFSAGVAFLIVSAVTYGALIPAVYSMLNIPLRDLLNEGVFSLKRKTLQKTIYYTVGFIGIPLICIATYLFASFLTGVILVSVIVLGYIFFGFFFSFLISILYKKRNYFSFSIKSILSQKYTDGVIGIVSFTSLFVALLVFSTMTLLQATLVDFLKTDIGKTIPSVYVIDIQESQKELLQSTYPALELFPNIPARILKIDNRNIQEEVLRGEGRERELGREYNITFRDSLLASEKIVKGDKSVGKKGFASVDKEFAERAGIRVGSQIVLSIQGFEKEVLVNSLRETDNRSGLPFFYFVLSKEDVAYFPKTFFGYAYYDEQDIQNMTTFLAKYLPNASIINTKDIRDTAIVLTNGILVLIFAVAIPPLVVSLLLIVTLIFSLFESRRRDAAQFVAIGATRSFVRFLYLTESLSGVVLAALIAYVVSSIIVFCVSHFYIGIDAVVFFDTELIFGFLTIIMCIFTISLFVWFTNKKTVKELLLEDK